MKEEFRKGALPQNSLFMLVRADASPAIGSGHIMRCLALAKAWQSVGGSVACLMAESIPALDEWMMREGVTLGRMAATPGSATDAEQTVAEAIRSNAAWVVVDGYRFHPDYVRTLKIASKNAGLRVLFLDDDGRFDFYAADVVLNQNISAKPELYAKREAFTRLLLGSEYVLLRPEFLAEPQAHEHPAIGRKVLVTMGGSDSENVTGKVLLALSQGKADFDARLVEVRVVIGGGNPRYEELRSLAESLSVKVQLERSPANMAPMMQWADVAISGAGGTCWELAYLGLPSIVIALSRDQQGIAKGLEEREIAVSLGWHANLSEERISNALDGLLSDHGRRIAMSERGQKLVDGQGAARVVKFLQSSL